MDVWDRRLLQVGRLIGFTPFNVDKSRNLILRVNWMSIRAFYFVLVTVLTQLILIFYCGSVASLISRKGIAFALRSTGWIGGLATTSAMQWIIIARHDKIVDHLNATYLLLGRKSSANLKWQNDKKMSFIFGLIFLGILPIISVSGHICFLPGDVYLHNLLQVYRPDYDPFWNIISKVIHCYSGVIYLLGTFLIDFLLIHFSMGYSRHFEEINQNIMLLKAEAPALLTRKGLTNIAFEVDQKPKKAGSEVCTKSTNLWSLRTYLRDHLRLQNSLETFSKIFDSTILAFPIQIFVMVLALFFGVVRGELCSVLETGIYICVGAQYLFRSYVGLRTFGKVHESGTATKSILLRDLQIQYEQHHLEPEMIFEVESFLCTVDDVAFKAGSFLTFSQHFLISFYGALVSYTAILIQSF